MVQSKVNQPNWLQYVTVVAVLLALFFSFSAYNKDVEMPEVPSAAEIASQVQVPSASVGLSAEEVRAIVATELATLDTDVNNDKLDKVFEEVYESEITALENKALNLYSKEFDKDEIEDLLESEIENFDKLENVDLDDDETEVTVVNLGLDDDEDKEVIVTKEYKVKYEKDDTTDNYKDVVYVKGTLTYDDDDGYEMDLEYSL